MNYRATKLTSVKRYKLNGKSAKSNALPVIWLVSIMVLAPVIGGASCKYYTSKSAFQASAVHEVLAAHMAKLEQQKLTAPSPPAPLIVDIHSIPTETYRIGWDRSYTPTNVDLNINITGLGGDVGGGGGGGGGG